MALCETRSLDARHKVFDANAHDTPKILCASVYRCAACGSEVPFDALMATCQCVDEASVSPTRAAFGSVAWEGYTPQS